MYFLIFYVIREKKKGEQKEEMAIYIYLVFLLRGRCFISPSCSFGL